MIDEREVRSCDRCGAPFHPVRAAQRFCCTECHDQYYPLERKQALAHWRQLQRQQQSIFLLGDLNAETRISDEMPTTRRRA
jgi:hypothetical protein